MAQFSALLRKNGKVILRSRATLYLQLAVPIGIVLMLLSLQQLTDYFLNNGIDHPAAEAVGTLQPSAPLIYAPKSPTTQRIMDRVQRNNPRSDISLLPNASVAGTLEFCFKNDSASTCPSEIVSNCFAKGEKEIFLCPCWPCGLIKDNATLCEHVLDNPNTVSNAVVFVGEYFGQLMPNSSSYVVFYNATVGAFPFDGNDHTLEVMRAVDEAILQLQTGNPNASIQASQKAWPKPEYRFRGFDVVATDGGVWFMVPGMLVFVFLLREIVSEAEEGLKKQMEIMGLNRFLYWVSWFIAGGVVALCSAGILILSGNLAGFATFTNANFFAMGWLFGAFGLAAVALAMFLSTIMTTVESAQTVGFAIVLVGFVFQGILSSGYGMLIDLLESSSVPEWVTIVRWILSLYAPFNLVKGYYDIASRSGAVLDFSKGKIVSGPGFSWEDVWKVHHLPPFFGEALDDPPTSQALFLLLVNAGLFAGLAIAMDAFRTEDDSAGRRLWLLLKGCCSRSAQSPTGVRELLLTGKNSDAEDPQITDSGVALQRSAAENPTDDCAIVLRKLCKTYTRGNVKALRDLSLTVRKGQVLALLGVNGAGKSTLVHILCKYLSATSGSADAKGLIGVCPQSNTFWGDLTPIEHLKLFAAVKGVPHGQQSTVADEILDLIEMTPLRNEFVRTFSQGMARRLQLGIALIGDPKVLLLDEITAGLDPVHRNEAWKLLNSLKAGRSVILTTHLMAEADAQSDVVAIMSQGRLHAYGTSLRLKNTYGGGYHVSLSANCPSDVSPIAERVKQLVPASRVLDIKGQTLIVFNLPPLSEATLPGVLLLLDALPKMATMGEIAAWSLSNATLGDVFANVCEDRKGQGESVLKQRPSKAVVVEQAHSRPFTALIRKNLSVMKRQGFNTCCQIVSPLLVLALMVLLQLILKSVVGDSLVTQVPSVMWPLNMPSAAQDSSTHKYGHSTCLEFFLFSAAPEAIGVGRASDTGERSGLLGEIRQSSCSLHNHSKVEVPYFLARDSSFAMENEVCADLRIMDNASTHALNRPPPCAGSPWNCTNYLLPDGFVSFERLNASSGQVGYTFSVNDAAIASYHRANNFSRLDNREIPMMHAASVLMIPQAKAAMMDLINGAMLSAAGVAEPLSIKVVGSLPEIITSKVMAIVEVFGAFLYPIVAALPLPLFLLVPAMEKERRLKGLQMVMGVSRFAYSASQYLLFLAMCAPAGGRSHLFCRSFSTFLIFWIGGLAASLRFFTQTSWWLLLFFFFGWSNALVCFARILSTVIATRKKAIILGYVISILGVLVALVICDGIFGHSQYFDLHMELPLFLHLFAPFAMVRGFFLMSYRCSALRVCYGSFWTGDEMETVVLALYVDCVLYFGISALVEYLQDPEAFRGSSPSPDACTAAAVPVLLDNLTRVFSRQDGAELAAVNRVSFAVRPSECFAVLGENGAGKSTIFKLLTGELAPTDGRALLWGESAFSHRVRRGLGFCPQEDVVWEELSVREHLLFYSRVKGVPPAELGGHVGSMLRQIGLEAEQHRLAKHLSGGMRRRLCVGIAFVGDNKVILLDEPSSGLDPLSRKQLWEIIASFKGRGSTLMLTTHLMEEAEILADRISIMVEGRLGCLGTLEELKERYGAGLALSVIPRSADAEAVNSFLMHRFSGLVRLTKEACQYTLPREASVSAVFTVMSGEEARAVGVVDWGVSQPTLEDVFCSVVAEMHSTS